MSTTPNLAEWSKALASGASPQGRGFEPHSCHFLYFSLYDEACIVAQNKESLHEKMVPRGLEPRTLRLLAVRSNQLSYETSDYRVPRFSSTLKLISYSLSGLYRARCRGCIVLVVMVGSCSLSWLYRAHCRGDIAFVVVVVRARCRGCSVFAVGVGSCSLSWT